MKKSRRPHIRKAFLAGKLSLVSLLAVVALKTISLPPPRGGILVPTSAVGTEVAAAQKEKIRMDNRAEDYSTLAERNIFGDAASPQNKPLQGRYGAGLLQPAEQDLGLELFGTVAGSALVARAIIKDLETNVLGLYKTGDIVAAAVVESIERNGVVLLHQGERKMLNLGIRASDNSDIGDTQQVQPKDTAEVKPAQTEPLIGPEKTIQARLADVETMLREAVLRPYSVEGHMEGLVIAGLEKLTAARDLGLQNGDIIRSVNGHLLSSRQKAYQIFKKARTQATMSIELLRDNKVRTLSFALTGP